MLTPENLRVVRPGRLAPALLRAAVGAACPTRPVEGRPCIMGNDRVTASAGGRKRPTVLVFCRPYLIGDFEDNLRPLADEFDFRFLTDGRNESGITDTRARFYARLGKAPRPDGFTESLIEIASRCRCCAICREPSRYRCCGRWLRCCRRNSSARARSRAVSHGQ